MMIEIESDVLVYIIMRPHLPGSF